MATEDTYGALNYALVKNVGSERAILHYNSVPFIVEPGDIEPVPFEAVANWCGDPRAAEEPQVIKVQGGDTRYIPSRYDERKRLRLLHGMTLEGGEDEIVDNGKIPHLEVKYRSKRAFTVLEDPYGEHLGMGTDERQVQQQAEMRDQVNFLEDQLRILKARYDGGLASPEERDFVPMTEDELPSDITPDPTVPPLPRPSATAVDWATAQPSSAFDE